MARSRRVLAILPRIGAKLGNSTPTDLHHDVFGLGKVAHLAPSILERKWGASAHSPTGASMAWSHTRRRHGLARSRRVLAILPRIGAKLGNSTPTDLHHDVFGLGKVAHLAPSILERKWGASAHSPTGASMAWSHTRRRHGLAMSTANDDLSTTQPLWRVPLTRTLV